MERFSHWFIRQSELVCCEKQVRAAVMYDRQMRWFGLVRWVNMLNIRFVEPNITSLNINIFDILWSFDKGLNGIEAELLDFFVPAFSVVDGTLSVSGEDIAGNLVNQFF